MTVRMTAKKFDAIFEPAATRRPSLANESLWGATTIARHLGVSDEFVRKLTKDRKCPIRVRGGRIYCTKSELADWLAVSPQDFSETN
jgi:Helix-turn-helix domain